jgi:hypothetical protein
VAVEIGEGTNLLEILSIDEVDPGSGTNTLKTGFYQKGVDRSCPSKILVLAVLSAFIV